MIPSILAALALLVLALLAITARTTHRLPALTFDDGPAIRLDSPQNAEAFEIDVEKRTIRGLAVPYGVTAKSNGQMFQFSKGTLKFADPRRVKLWVQHKPDQAIGVATKLDDRDDGLHAEFSIATGTEGDRILALAQDGVLDGLSLGLGKGGQFTTKGGVQHAVSVPLMEISLTPSPSFDDARVHAVAASAAGGVGDAGDGGAGFAASLGTTIRKAMFQSLSDVPAREYVAAGGRQFSVREEAAYRFDGIGGEHDFSTDFIAAVREKNGEAEQRVLTFMQEQFGPSFDVDTADIGAVNPSRQRPDMYVDRLDYDLPVYRALYKGALADNTPFIFPKYNTSSGLVADHVEAVEPTPGAFTVTSQTVTPTAVSGKAEITREVFDAGGNPKVSVLIWNEMVRGYFEALEAAGVAVLDAATPTAIALTAGFADDELVNQLEAKFVELQFIRGGNRFNFMPTHVDLYKALAAAVDSTGRKLLPMYGPTNANGGAAKRWGSLDVGGMEAAPSWALGASGAVVESSYLVNTGDVHIWNSAPKRLDFEYRVAYVDLAIWGYKAAAISRLDGVREITYDPVA